VNTDYFKEIIIIWTKFYKRYRQFDLCFGIQIDNLNSLNMKFCTPVKF